MTQIHFTINGHERTVEAPPLKRLLDVLREDLHLTGAKEGCGEGECGSCSVLMNGELVNSCLIPTLQAEGAQITTIEGLALLANSATSANQLPQPSAEGAPYTSLGRSPRSGIQDEDQGLKARPINLPQHLHPIQQCFLERGGAQCGICTPGMILATHHLLEKYPQPTLLQIQEGLAGNLCRCTGYARIFDAVQAAAEQIK
jgi:carbon-monoxide dehydrogenase small subunit